MRIRTLWPAAIIAAAVAAPVGIALAATEPGPEARAVSTTLHAPLAGHATAAGAMREAGRGRIAREHIRLARRYDALTGRHTARAPSAARCACAPPACARSTATLRGEVRELDIPIPAVLRQGRRSASRTAIPRRSAAAARSAARSSSCVSTWAGVGGNGDPAAAPAQGAGPPRRHPAGPLGPSPWPVCGA